MTDQENSLPERIDPNVVPRWVTEKYTGMANDIEQWYTSFYFYKTWDGKLETLDSTKAKARAKALAKYQSLMQTKALFAATEGSIQLQIYDAVKNGWYKKINEIEDAKEFIEHVLEVEREKNPHASAVYELEFIHNTLVPTLEKLDVPKEAILCISSNMTKAKWAVKSLKQIINNNGPDMEDHLLEMMNAIADTNTTVDVFREEVVPRIMGLEAKKTLPPVEASVCMLPDNRELIIIPSDPAHTRAIQMSTKSIVEGFGYTDPTYLITQVMKTIRPKDFSRHKYRANEFGVLKTCAEGGVYLPATETFRELVMSEYNKHNYYLRKKGEQTLAIEELAFSYNIDDFTKSLGYLKMEDAFVAIINMYEPLLEHLEIRNLEKYYLDIALEEIVLDRPAYHLLLRMTFGETCNS